MFIVMSLINKMGIGDLKEMMYLKEIFQIVHVLSGPITVTEADGRH